MSILVGDRIDLGYAVLAAQFECCECMHERRRRHGDRSGQKFKMRESITGVEAEGEVTDVSADDKLSKFQEIRKVKTS